jgi:lipopolysaccharide/colanic/teichoic acid biosynthesis glycosyltransferase
MSQNVPRRRRVEPASRFDRSAFNACGDRLTRIGQLVIACTLLAATLALMILVALAIKLESTGPVLERRDCIGHGGRRFQMLKFRTTAYDPGRSTPPWARQLTRVGQLLRYTRIDALPQLINVLRHEMSMIDTGTHVPSFLD